MMIARTIAIGAAAAMCLCAAAATAADLPSRAPPPVFVPPAPVFTWTGFYIGGYGGGSFEGRAKLSSAIGAVTIKRQGFTGGGVAGYNYQIGRIVLGVEGDGGYDGEQGSSGLRIPAFVTTTAFRLGVKEKSDGFVARGRGRVGFAAGNFFLGDTLIYAAGGGSYLDERFTFTVPGLQLANLSKERVGFNIGGGVEVAFAPQVIARIEYIYDDYGKINYPGLLPKLPFKATLNDNTVRGALIYKF